MTILSPVLHHHGPLYWITFLVAFPGNPAHAYRRLPLRVGEVRRAERNLEVFVRQVMEREPRRIVYAP